MMSPREFADELPPRIALRGLPKEERTAAGFLESSLYDLERYVQDFDAALALFDFSTAQEQAILESQPGAGIHNNQEIATLIRWLFIAARDGIMTIYHFGITMQAIRAALVDCPKLNTWIDTEKLRTATKLYNSYFPRVISLRNAVAHYAELAKDEESFEKNICRDGLKAQGFDISSPGNILIQNVLIDRQLTMSFKGDYVSYEINQKSLDHLYRVKERIYSVFRKAESESLAAAIKKASQRSTPPKFDEPPK